MVDPFELNLRHLRAIPLIVRRGSMSAAASAASLSQPALAQGLAKVEHQLGVRLFERRPDGMTPTADGMMLAERIESAITHLSTATRRSRGFAKPERRMTATQLRAFLALAASGSFAEAARETGWSQPALHRAVRDLEQLSAGPLVERRGRGVTLTTDGRRLARGIRLAAAELAAGIADTRADGSLAGRLVVGAMPLSRALLLPAAIAALMRDAPAATVDVVEGSWRELVEPLRDGAIDLMVGALRETAPLGTDQEALFEDHLVIVARAGHPLARSTSQGLTDLARYPWIVGPAGAPLRAHWERLFVSTPRPHTPIECGSVMTIRGILLDSDCLTLLSPDQIAMEVDSGLLAVIGRPRGDMIRTIGITTRAGWRPTTLQAHFIDLLRVHGSRA